MPIIVSIVEDHAPLRQILSEWIGQVGDMRLGHTYPDAESALADLPQHPADVVLMDINLPGLSGIECVRQLKGLLPATQFMMVTVYMDTDRIFKALAAGATGYLLKRSAHTELLQAIREVAAGGSPMSRNIARRIVETFHTSPPQSPVIQLLSERELDVLRLLARGQVNKEIAAGLQLSFHTIHTLVRRIYEKLHVHTRRDAIARFHQANQPRQPD
ncbi:MAG: response regulator transcription factor [Verrucomicrobia bacterium]|nr:MAG: response regulator transcription factor [Verrucomicrobiota bacterium]